MVTRKVEEQVAQRRLQPGSLPPDAGNLAGLVLALLEQCRGEGLPYTFRNAERMTKKSGRMPPYDVRVREHREHDAKDITTGVLFVTNSGRSATEALKRLLNDEHPPHHRLLVTDQERRPLKMGEQGVAYYRDLEKLGKDSFEHIKLDFEQYAALDAARGRRGTGPRGGRRDRVAPGDDPARQRGRGRRLEPPQGPLSPSPAAPSPAVRGASDRPPGPADSEDTPGRDSSCGSTSWPSFPGGWGCPREK